MNINDIKLGETYQYYFHDAERHLRHFPVEVVKLNKKSVRVVTSKFNAKHEFRVDPSELDNRQLEAF